MATTDGWVQHVDEVLSELSSGGADDSEMTANLRANKIGEYEPGIKPEDFKKILEGLGIGDVIVFHFKRFAKWPMNFLVLFGTRKTCFEYVEDQLPSYQAINFMAMRGGRFGSSYLLKCKIRDVPIGKEHSIDWMTRYLTIYLKDVTVEKPA